MKYLVAIEYLLSWSITTPFMKISSFKILWFWGYFGSNENLIPETPRNLPSKPGHLQTPFSNNLWSSYPVIQIVTRTSGIANILFQVWIVKAPSLKYSSALMVPVLNTAISVANYAFKRSAYKLLVLVSSYLILEKRVSSLTFV